MSQAKAWTPMLIAARLKEVQQNLDVEFEGVHRIHLQLVPPKDQDPEPWHPMTHPVDVKHLNKANEEFGEAIGAMARCLNQGIDEINPSTGQLNREWFEDEMADALAVIAMNIDHFKLDEERINARMRKKIAFLTKLHAGA